MQSHCLIEPRASSHNPANFTQFGQHSMQETLAFERESLSKVNALFKGLRFEDISADKALRSTGTDTLLYLNPAEPNKPIFIEHKFERYATGRMVLEYCSVDRGAMMKAGWFLTSQAAWLFSWFPSGELIVCNMAQLRALALSNPARHYATTTFNERSNYMSWNALEDINYILWHVEHAYVLDLKSEIGEHPTHPSMVSGVARSKVISLEQLKHLMLLHPYRTQSLNPTEEHVKAFCRLLAPKNFKKTAHAPQINALPWLHAP